jgi:hypothetical protein
MNMLWHQYECVEAISFVAAVPIEYLEEKTNVVVYYK